MGYHGPFPWRSSFLSFRCLFAQSSSAGAVWLRRGLQVHRFHTTHSQEAFVFCLSSGNHLLFCSRWASSTGFSSFALGRQNSFSISCAPGGWHVYRTQQQGARLPKLLLVLWTTHDSHPLFAQPSYSNAFAFCRM